MPKHPPFGPQDRDLARKGGQVSGEVRRAKAEQDVQATLDRLASESFHTFYTKRLGKSEPTRMAWHVVAKRIDGVPWDQLNHAERALWLTISGGRAWSTTRPITLVLLIGRGGGKTEYEGAYAAYLATRRYDLRRGERAVILLMAGDQEQADTLFTFIHDNLHDDPELRRLVTSSRNDAIDLAHGVNIKIRPGHFKKVRGPKYAGVFGDETSHWQSDEFAANPDTEVIRAVKPGLFKMRGKPGQLFLATTPYLQQGATWDLYDKHYGKESETTLVLQGETRLFNPTMSEEEIAREIAEDPLSASEWQASWRTDLAAFLSLDAINAVTDVGILERPPAPGVTYFAFVDMTGGGKDSLALCIAHLSADGETVIVDVVRERKPPLDIQGTIDEWAPLLRDYGIAAVTGDQYAKQLTVEAWSRAGVSYDFSPLSASELYLELLPVVNTRRCQLLDDPTLRLQLSRLVRQARRGGRDLVSHLRSQHDDVANVCAGAIVLALGLGMGASEPLINPAWLRNRSAA